jgi:hypothetical protein
MTPIPKGYEIRKSTRKLKKYDLYKDGKYFLSFGSSAHEQFRDTTPLRAYKHLDHGDEDRRRRYMARHGTTTDKSSAKYWANKFLWSA